MELIKPFGSFWKSFSDELTYLEKWKLCLKDPAFLILLLLDVIVWADAISNNFYCA